MRDELDHRLQLDMKALAPREVEVRGVWEGIQQKTKGALRWRRARVGVVLLATLGLGLFGADRLVEALRTESSSIPATIAHQDDLNATNLGDRIPIAIPATIIFEGRTYAAVDKTPTKVKVIPDDLSPAGFVDPRPGEERVALQGSDPRVFSIKGIDKSQAVAIRFWSANGQYFYYLEYQVLE